jgi:ABC-2 type transport system ATP-binding protein
MAKTVLKVRNLKKNYGEFEAVKGISFELKEGEILGLLGPNGAGKTTTIQMLLGTTSVTAGKIEYFGKNFFKHRSEILNRVNYGSAYDHVPSKLTVWENLQFYARLYGVEDRSRRILRLLEEFDILGLKNDEVMYLSAGQKTRVNLCKAFINFPRVILLDEPTASLDPEVASRVRRFIVKQQRKYGVAVLFTSHNMAEVTEVCDRVMFLKEGRVIVEDTPEGLTKRIKYASLRLLVGDGLKRTIAFAQEQKLEYRVDERSIKFRIEEQLLADFLENLAKKGISYSEISIEKPTLEDFFLSMSDKEDRK